MLGAVLEIKANISSLHDWWHVSFRWKAKDACITFFDDTVHRTCLVLFSQTHFAVMKRAGTYVNSALSTTFIS